MRHHLPLALALTALVFASCNNSENVVLKNQADTLSWAMGMSLAETVQSGFYQFDEKLIQKAIANTLKDGKQPLSNEEYREALMYINFLAQTYEHNQSKKAETEANSSQEQLFAQLAKNPNIHKAPEGYYYEVLQEGHGPKAKEGLRVRFDFKGTEMQSGNLIEQTYGNREPIIHVLGRPMFEGLIYGMQLMNAGSKYRFYFPYQLVSGANGIPANTPVIYEVELHEIFLN